MPTVSVLGSTVYYEQTNSDAVRADTPPYTFVFIHGVGGAVETWAGIRAYLLKYNCIYIDLPGHGRSLGEALGVDENAAVVAGLLDQVVPGERCIFVGISYGTAVAMKLAAAYDSYTRGLVLMSPRTHFSLSNEELDKIIASVEDGSFVERGAGRTTSETMKQGMKRGMARVPSETIRRLFEGYNGFDIRKQLDGIHVPTVILSGLEDGISDRDDAALIQEKIQNSELILLHTGHFIPIEDSRCVVKALKDFIHRLPS